MERSAPHPDAAAESVGRGWEPVDSESGSEDNTTTNTTTTSKSRQQTKLFTKHKAKKNPLRDAQGSDSEGGERPSRSSSHAHLRNISNSPDQGQHQQPPQHQSQPPPLSKRRPGHKNQQLQRNQSTGSAYTLANVQAAGTAGNAPAAPSHEHIHHRKKQFVAHTGARLGGHTKRAVSKGSRTNLVGIGAGADKRRSAVFQHGPHALQRTTSANSATSERQERKSDTGSRGFIVGSSEDTDREEKERPREKDKGKQPEQRPQEEHTVPQEDNHQQQVQEMPAQRRHDSPAMLPVQQRAAAHVVDPQVTTTIAKGQHVMTLQSQASSSNLATTTPPLTSHFLDSPGTSHRSSVSPSKRPQINRSVSTASQHHDRTGSSSSQTSAVPLRTQQKLWLQRQSSQLSPPAFTVPPAAAPSQPAFNTTLVQSTPQSTAHCTPVLERIARDYANVRRYRDPVGEGISRILHSKKFLGDNGAGGSSNETAMGLSQSLKDNEARKGKTWGNSEMDRARSSMDDLGVGKKVESEEEILCRRLWGEGELLVSNE